MFSYKLIIYMYFSQINHIQERISILQQHEANDQCMGGVHCPIVNPMYQPAIMEPSVPVVWFCINKYFIKVPNTNFNFK